MQPDNAQLPAHVLALLEQDYTDFRVVFQLESVFVAEGIRVETSTLEMIEGASFDSRPQVLRLQRGFEACRNDPENSLGAIDCGSLHNYYYARYRQFGSSLYRRFVSRDPYLAGEEGLNMLTRHLLPLPHRDDAEVLAVLQAGIGLCEALQRLHDHNILHNNINSHTVFFIDGKIVLHSCGSSTNLLVSTVKSDGDDGCSCRNQLPYLSPESSGRTGTKPDFRSDIYSVGCTLYELFTGRPPFVASDQLSLIHRHLTVIPATIDEISEDLPVELAAVIAKCLAKSPNMRYQSVAGLRFDLQELVRILNRQDISRPFELASLDNLMRFRLANSLCGRESELSAMESAWQEVRAGQSPGVVLISGVSGIGKTRLISSFLSSFWSKNKTKLFAAGKYQSSKRDLPFYALIEALQNMIRQALTHSQSSIKAWRAELSVHKKVVGVLAQSIPELKLLLSDHIEGDLSTNSELAGKRHVQDAFVAILNVLSLGAGLVLVQDDVQWASPEDLDLMIAIITRVPRSLLVVGQRLLNMDKDNEVSSGWLQIKNVNVKKLKLSNFSVEDVRMFVTETLRYQTLTELSALAKWLHETTKGNPSDIGRLLGELHQRGVLYFQIDAKCWRFDMRNLRQDELTDDIIEVIISDMNSLTGQVRTMLITAAALGQEYFSLHTLNSALGQRLEETVDHLTIASNHNILKTQENVSGLASSSSDMKRFCFLHDLVQEHAYALLPPADQPNMHYTIASNIEKQISAGADNHNTFLFLLANQYNRCLQRSSLSEKEHAIECNLSAGNLALKLSDTSTAIYYFEVAENISEVAHINSLTRMKIRLALIEAKLAANAYQEVLEMIHLTFPLCVSQRDVIKCYQSELKAQMALGNLNDAVIAGLNALDRLRCPMPGNDLAAQSFSERMAALLQHDPESIMELANGPRLTDDVQLQIQEVLTLLVLPVYMVRPAILSSLCYLSLSITSKCGISLEGAYPAMMLGAYLSSIGGRQNLLKSHAYGKFALQLLGQFEGEDTAIASGMYHLFAGHIAVFHQPMLEVMKYEDLAIATGNVLLNAEYAISLVEKPIFLAWNGRSLKDTLLDLNATEKHILRTKRLASKCFLAVHMHGIANFSDQESDALIKYSPLSSADPGDTLRAELSLNHAFMWELWNLLRLVILGNGENLQRCVRRCCIEYCDGVLGTHYAAMAFWMASVTILTRTCLDMEIHTDELVIVEKGRRMLREFAEFAPSTFSAKIKLLDCLSYRGQKNHDNLQLLDMYEEVATEADRYGGHLDKALALESASRWLTSVSPGRSPAFIQRTYDAYNTWGCKHKMRLLEQEFSSLKPSLSTPQLTFENPTTLADKSIDGYSPNSHAGNISSPAASSEPVTRVSQTPSSVTNVKNSSLVDYNQLSELDIKTILSASIQISQGMKAEEVFENLMKTVLLAAGANYGVLAMHNSDTEHRLDVNIHTLANGESISLMNNTAALDRPDLLPLSIVNTVLATQKSIILEGHQDYALGNSFAQDSYFQSKGRSFKSVLCMPIFSTTRNKARGVLYLENNATSSAFTHQRLECLTLLCKQSAVMLERAGIYHEMQAAKVQAEEATAQKSTFLANMSHEIRTPFNALLSCAIFLLDTVLTQVQKDYVLTIRDSATLTLSIIDDILDFSKVEQGKMDLVLTRFSLVENIETAMQVVAQKASHAGIDLVFSQNHDVDQIIGDSHHLRQVVLNLLSNAVKFTSNGYVKITSMARETMDDRHSTIILTVEDTGIGISSKGLEKLFKAFSQVDAATNRSYGGTGLGLAISKKLVELMEGKIWVESAEGRGTKFSLEIPVEIDAASKATTPIMRIAETPSIIEQGRLALVISRFNTTADVLVGDLGRIGLTTDKNTEILDPDSIAEAAGAKPYSLLLVDLQVDGALGLIQSLQKVLPSRHSHFKIVILTHYGFKIPPDMSSDKIVGYLVKPVTKKKLRDLVSSALGSISGDENGTQRSGDLKPKDGHTSGPEKQNTLSILLAEDNIINTKVAIQHLKRLGYTNVKHAKDGVEVLELCDVAAKQHCMFDLILMDVQMPRLDGIGATIELRKRYPNPKDRPVIIALTANATSSDRQRCLDAGMSDQCSKPNVPEDLKRALDSVKPRGSPRPFLIVGNCTDSS